MKHFVMAAFAAITALAALAGAPSTAHAIGGGGVVIQIDDI